MTDNDNPFKGLADAVERARNLGLTPLTGVVSVGPNGNQDARSSALINALWVRLDGTAELTIAHYAPGFPFALRSVGVSLEFEQRGNELWIKGPDAIGLTASLGNTPLASDTRDFVHDHSNMPLGANTVGTSQLVDNGVTNAKIASMAASKLTGTFDDNIAPDTDDTRDLGADGAAFANAWVNRVYFSEDTEPATPLAGKSVLYVKSDGKIYLKDDAGTEYDLTSSGGGGYDTIADEGTGLTQRTLVNFIGTGVTAADDAGNTRTDVTIPGLRVRNPSSLFDENPITDMVFSSSFFDITSGGAGRADIDLSYTPASIALSNLASVAINTSLISDTDSADDLGATGTRWRDTYTDRVFITDSARLEPATAPGSPTDGDTWTDSTRASLTTRQGGMTQYTLGVIRVITADSGPVETTIQTSLIGGLLTIPSALQVVGKTFLFEVFGQVSRGGGATGLTLRIKVAGSNDTIGNRAGSVSAINFHARAMVTFRTTGASGSCQIQGFYTEGNNVYSAASNPITRTVNTTTATTLDLAAGLDNLGAGDNFCLAKIATVTVLN